MSTLPRVTFNTEDGLEKHGNVLLRQEPNLIVHVKDEPEAIWLVPISSCVKQQEKKKKKKS